MSQLSLPNQTLNSLSNSATVPLSVSSQLRQSVHDSIFPNHLRDTSHNPSLLPATTTNQPSLESAQARWRTLFSTPAPLTFPSSTRPTTLSNHNSKTNEPWGDPLQDKPDDVTRVYVTNLNGIQLDARGGKFDTVCRTIRDLKADIFCGQEHDNVDTTQAPLRNIIFDTASQHWERHRIVISTTPIPFKTPFKPGGTFVLTTGSLTGRICKQIRDK